MAELEHGRDDHDHGHHGDQGHEQGQHGHRGHDHAHGHSDRRIVEEFRATGGRVAGFEHQPLLLLHHVRATTGIERVHPVGYLPLDGGFAIFATNSGASTEPRWLADLIAHPEVTVEVGSETLPVRARVADGEDRERLWAEQVRRNPGFVDLERQAGRRIPVVVLERRA
ncbi:MAG: nitroreductase family deazaflavin-dependent oxidoreductase [Candidatus Velamenicoccus archaeovorus]